MTGTQWLSFSSFRDEFKRQVCIWNSQYADELQFLQCKAAELDGTPPYQIETPIVYNNSLDNVTRESDIKLIIIGDNPGKNEQLAINSRYLVGQAGKLAASFFKHNDGLGIDFNKNVIILNKTPVHTAKTKELRYLLQHGSPSLVGFLQEASLWMADKTTDLHKVLNNNTERSNNTNSSNSSNNTNSTKNTNSSKSDNLSNDPSNNSSCALWLVGYSELKNKGIFLIYKNEFLKAYCPIEKCKQNSNSPNIADKMCSNVSCSAWNSVFVYQHFSMNRFSIDLSNFLKSNSKNVDLVSALAALGLQHRLEIFGV